MYLNLQALLLLCAAALAESQAIQVPSAPVPSAPQSSATIHQTVNNVLVDVVVTDKYGQPLKGLTKEQFQVIENGSPQQIAFFEEHQAQPAPAPPAHPLQLPPNVYTNIATTAPDTGPTLILLMDALNTPSADQVKVRLAMLEYLRKIPSGSPIAIFTLTSKLRMVQGFNSDPAALTASLDQAATWQKQSHLTDDVGQDTYADSMPKLGIGTAATGTSDVFQNFVAHEQAWRTDQRVGYTLDALNALATYLSALPGRKNLIWFSGSFPLAWERTHAIPQGASSGFQTENLDRSRDYSAQIRSTGDLLKLARVAVYPMDPSALPTPSMFSSTQPNAGSVRGGSALNQDNVDSTNELSAHATMDAIAEETGGRAFYSTNDLASAITAVTQLGSNYYMLAYVPKEKNYDGKYRKLSIKVEGAKVRLDYRRGYYAEDPDKSAVGTLAHPTRTSAVLLHGAPAATDILFKVRVAPTEVTTQSNHPGVVRYSVNWSVDLHGLILPASSDGIRRADLALALVAYNNDSKAINSVSTPVSLILQADEYQKYLKSGLQFHQEIDLPTGKAYLRIAIVDTANDRAGATEIPLIVREAKAQAAATQPPAPH